MRMNRHVRRRLQLAAADYPERGIHQDEIEAAVTSFARLVQLAGDRGLSIDWLCFGDLRGLQRQQRWTSLSL